MKKKSPKNNKTLTKDVYKPISLASVEKKWMKDKVFRKAYKELEPQYSLIAEIIKKRIDKNISQKELSKRFGTGQSAISRFESGKYNPTLKFLQKLASALDSELVIKFK